VCVHVCVCVCVCAAVWTWVVHLTCHQAEGVNTLLSITKFIYGRVPMFMVFICASTTLHNSRGSLLHKLKGARVASITQQLHMYFLKILFVEPSAHLVVMKTLVSTALRVTIWSNRSKYDYACCSTLRLTHALECPVPLICITYARLLGVHWSETKPNLWSLLNKNWTLLLDDWPQRIV